MLSEIQRANFIWYWITWVLTSVSRQDLFTLPLFDYLLSVSTQEVSAMKMAVRDKSQNHRVTEL